MHKNLLLRYRWVSPNRCSRIFKKKASAIVLRRVSSFSQPNSLMAAELCQNISVSIHKKLSLVPQQAIWSTTEQQVVILYDSCQHLSPLSQWEGATILSLTHPTTIGSAEFYSSFDINTSSELRRQGVAPLQPTWPISAWGYGRRVHTSAAAEGPSPRSLLVSSPLLPCSPGQLPILF